MGSCRGNPSADGWLPALRPKASGRRAEGGHKGCPYFILWQIIYDGFSVASNNLDCRASVQ
jgi:hypothetical protein